MNKELKIEIPEGYEIDKDKSIPFEKIVFKKIESKYPLKVSDIEHKRSFFIDLAGHVNETKIGRETKNHLSSRERAKAFLALIQLVELRDAWNKIDDFIPDWEKSSQNKYCILVVKNKTIIETWNISSKVLYFKTPETSNLFLETFQDLIETAKELI